MAQRRIAGGSGRGGKSLIGYAAELKTNIQLRRPILIQIPVH
jgi:hypothetical protein